MNNKKEIKEIKEIMKGLEGYIKILEFMDIFHGGEYRLAAKWELEDAMGFLRTIITVNKLNERE